jgi:hypothetical protein
MLTNTAKAARFDRVGAHADNPLTPGLIDRFGERWATTDADGTAFELLRFRAEVAAAPGFEDALRERVAALRDFRDPAFPAIHEVTRDGDQVTLVTAAVAGQRLSEIAVRLGKAKRLPFVTRLLRDATRALAALEAAAPGVTHGALTADRIVLSPDGRVHITEHVFAAALQELALWPEELWTDFGLLARPDEEGEAIFDPRTTVMQLAVVALSVLLARPITLPEFEQRLPLLIEEFSGLPANATSQTAAAVRVWLKQALQLGAEPYATAAEADAGLKKLLATLGPAGAGELDTIQFPLRGDGAADKAPEPARVTTTATPSPAAVPVDASVISVRRSEGDVGLPHVDDVPVSAPAQTRSQRERILTWAAIALLVVAVGEAIAITRLLLRAPAVVLTDSSITIESPRAGDTVMVDGKAVGSTPLRVRVNPKTQAIKLVAAAPLAEAAGAGTAAVIPATDRTAAAIDQAAARQRSGGVAFTAPFELKVFEGDRVLGSTADGPIVAPAGRHELDLVNTALGYRSRQTVTIRSGVIAPVTITPPMGRISINAQPWAQVLIDDALIGETPLANIAIAVGEHQVTFRHPQMGERRERVIVRADAAARVSTSFQR